MIEDSAECILEFISLKHVISYGRKHHSAAKNHVSIKNLDRSSLRLHGNGSATVEKVELIATLPVHPHTVPV